MSAMNTRKQNYGLRSAGLVGVVTAFLLAATTLAGPWYAIAVMGVAAVWFGLIALEDRPLTADEKRIRARLRRSSP